MDFNPANAVPEDYKPQASFNPANAIPDSGDAMPAPVATGIPKPKEDKKSYEDKSATYYGNLDGVPERLDPDKRAALDTLINAALPDQKKEYVARSVNQWFVGSQMPDTEPQWIADNWENAKRGFVKTRMGLDIDKISDETMYDMIGRRLKDGRIDPKEPFTWHVPLTVFPVQDAEKAAHETFWESLNVPAIEAKTYDLSKIPDMNISEIPFSNPRIAAAVWNGTAVPLINSLTSPLGIATLGVFSVGGALEEAGSALAGKAVWGLKAGFSAMMGYGAYEGGKETIRKYRDPNATTGDVVESASGTLLNTALALHQPLSELFERLGTEAKTTAKSIEEKTPTGAAQVLREQAAKTKDVEVAKAASEAAKVLEDIGKYENGPKTWEIASQSTFDFSDEIKPDGEQTAFPDASEEPTKETPPVEEKTLEEKEQEAEIPFPASPFNVTSLKNEAAELESLWLNKTGLSKNEINSIAPKILAAKQIIQNTPEAGADLLTKLVKDPNLAMTPEDNALLLAYKIKLLNAAAEADDIRNDVTQTPELRAEAERQFNELGDEHLKLVDANAARASDAGLKLRWQQVLVNENYDYLSQSTLLRSAKGNVPLTLEEEDQLREKINVVKAAQDALDEHTALKKEVNQNSKIDDLISKTTDTKREPVKFKYAEKVQEILKKKAAESRKILASGKVLSLGPDTLYHLGVVGAENIYTTGLDFAKWSAEMVRDIGEKVKPFLPEAWNMAKSVFTEEYRNNSIEELRAAIKAGDNQEIGSTAKELARSFIIDGVRNRDELVDSVHNILKKEIPELEKRETRDAISGYGKYTQLTFDEVGYILRDIKGQLQQISKLEDIEQGKPIKKTGVEKRQASEEEKKLIKQVREEQKKKNIKSVADKAKDRLASIEKNLSSKIADLTQQFETMQKAGEKAPAETNEKIEGLKALRERIKDNIADLEPKKVKGEKVVTPEDEINRRVKAIDSSIAKLENELQEGKIKPDAKEPSKVTSPELEEKQKYYDSLKQFREELRAIEEPEISPEQRALESQKARLEAQIEKRKAVLESGAPRPERPVNRPAIEEIEKAKQELESINKQIAELRRPKLEPEIEKTPQEKALERIQKRLTNEIKILQDQIDTRVRKAKGKPSIEYDSKTEDLREKRDQVKKQYKLTFGDDRLNAEQKLNRWKAAQKIKAEMLEDKIKRGDFEPTRKTTDFNIDDEGIKLKQRVERAKQEIQLMREKAKLERRPTYVKVGEYVSGVARGAALSGYHTLAKLASFTGAELANTPVAEAVGKVLARVPGFKTIAENADLEYGSEFESLAKFYAKYATDGAREAWQTLSKGKGDIKAELGNPMRNIKPREWYDYFGMIHEAEKAPLLVADFNLRLAKLTERAIANGEDINDAEVQAAMRLKAYNYAAQSILQENNEWANFANKLFGDVEARNPDLQNPNVTKVALATLAKTFITKGIVKTPLNYIRTAIRRSPIGLIEGTGRFAIAHMKGIDKLDNEEANAIYRLFKYGAPGTAMFVWGMIDATKPPDQRMFGGYYQPGQKRDPKDVSFGKIKLFNIELPHYVTHNLLTEQAQMGNTFMRVLLSKLRKTDAEDEGYIAGTVATLWGLVGQAPVVGPIGETAVAASRGQYQDAIMNVLYGLTPGLSANIAQDLDTKDGKPVKRKAKTYGQAVELGIPGLRENVPESTKSMPKRDVGKRFKAI